MKEGDDMTERSRRTGSACYWSLVSLGSADRCGLWGRRRHAHHCRHYRHHACHAVDHHGGTCHDNLGVDLTRRRPTWSTACPAKYVESFGQRPIVVLFYVPGGVDDEKVLKARARAAVPPSASYTFLTYDYGCRRPTAILPKRSRSTTSRSWCLIDDGTRTSTRVWSGYVDKGTLNQSLINLGRL